MKIIVKRDGNQSSIILIFTSVFNKDTHPFHLVSSQTLVGGLHNLDYFQGLVLDNHVVIVSG